MMAGKILKRFSAAVGLTALLCLAFAGCRTTDASINIDRLTGCKFSWVTDSGDAQSPTATPRRNQAVRPKSDG